jgi:hypothetical protein
MALPVMAYAEEKLALLPLADPPVSDTEAFFSVTKDGAQVNGEVIREFAISGDRVTVAYKNATDEALSPKYTIKIYNRYGIMIGSDEVSAGLLGGSPRLEPGDVGGDKLHVEWVDLDSIFKHSSAGTLPEDFKRAKWLSISASNSKVEQGVGGKRGGG